VTGTSDGPGEGSRYALGELLQLVDRLLQFSEFSGEAAPDGPAETSPVMIEMSRQHEVTCPEWGDDPIGQADRMATLLMVAAEDHLRSLAGLYSSGQISVYSPPVLLRSLLETAGRVIWMADTAIDHEKRAARGMTEVLHDAYWHRPTLAGDERRAFDEIVDRYAIIRGAQRLGYDVNKKEVPFWVGQRRPTSREAIDLAFRGIEGQAPAGALFRQISAIAHGSTHGLIGNLEAESTRLGETVLVARASSRQVEGILGRATYAYLAAADERRRWLGWASPEWVEAREAAKVLLLSID
jgi:hypothetical protein